MWTASSLSYRSGLCYTGHIAIISGVSLIYYVLVNYVQAILLVVVATVLVSCDARARRRAYGAV